MKSASLEAARNIARGLVEAQGGFGRWLRAEALEDHRTFEGLLIPTRRRVTPRLPGGVPSPGPALVNIKFGDVRIVPLVGNRPV